MIEIIPRVIVIEVQEEIEVHAGIEVQEEIEVLQEEIEVHLETEVLRDEIEAHLEIEVPLEETVMTEIIIKEETVIEIDIKFISFILF